jgi:integrase
MKEKRDHRVPLPDRAIAILKELPREGEFVFIGGWKNHPIGKNTFLKLIRGLGHEHVTAHGSAPRSAIGLVKPLPSRLTSAKSPSPTSLR